MAKVKNFSLSQKGESLRVAIAKNGGKPLAAGTTTDGFKREEMGAILLESAAQYTRELDAFRTGTHANCGGIVRDMTFGQFCQLAFGFSGSETEAKNYFYESLGVNPADTTLASFKTLTYADNSAYRFLVYEIFLDAIRTGLMVAPIHSKLIKAEKGVNALNVYMPQIKGANGVPKFTREGETIRMGTMTYGGKAVRMRKYTHGFRLTDEVMQYTALDVLAVAMLETTKMYGLGMDRLCFDTLLNGDQKDGSLSAPVIGINAANNLEFEDITAGQIRMSMLGQSPNIFVTSEQAGAAMRKLPEFKGFAGDKVMMKLNGNFPLPQELDHYVSPFMRGKKIAMLNSDSCMLKLVSSGLRIETDREILTQETVATVSTTIGFTNIVRDSRLVVDYSQNIAAVPFPDYMNIEGLIDEIDMSTL